MKFFRWINSRLEMAPVNRVSAVAFDDRFLYFQWAHGSRVSVPWDGLRRVLIRTTDGGPFDEDVFFVVEQSDRSYVIPHQAACAGELLERLQQLPGFDNEAVINAMACTENKEFLCWERRGLEAG